MREFVQEREYVTHRKASGYRSYHLIIEYMVDTIQGAKTILVGNSKFVPWL